MISVKDALRIHAIIIEKIGGTNGLRDEGALISALARPFATFDSVELYPSPIRKAAALAESIIVNHPFVDGNKRMGYVLMRLLLMKYGYDIAASENQKYDFIIGIANGQLKTEQIYNWLEQHVTKK